MARRTLGGLQCALLLASLAEGAVLRGRDSWDPRLIGNDLREVARLLDEWEHKETWDSRVPGDKQDWQANSELLAFRNESGKDFIFCAVPKNGCTIWKQLMLRANHVSHWNTTNKTLIHNPDMSGLDLVEMNEIFDVMGPGSTAYKAVVVRDPAVRLLSSYLDRCIDNHEWHRCLAEEPISLDRVVSNYEALTADAKRDVHFRNQSGHCGLQFREFATWDFVGKYEDFVNVSKHILQEANLWDLYGKSGWGADGKGSFGVKEQPLDNHPTGEHHTEDKMCTHYTPSLLHRVERLYRPDYQEFGYAIEPWLETCRSKWSKKSRSH